jgi:hypothetical protein
MDWFSTTERLDDAAGLLADRLGWPRPSRLGAINESPRLDDVTDADREFLEEHHALDRALHERASGELERRLAAAPAPDPWSPPQRSHRLRRKVTIGPDHPFWGDNWLTVTTAEGAGRRWSGPGHVAWAGFPVTLSAGTRVEVALTAATDPRNLTELIVRINAATLRDPQLSIDPDDGSHVWSGYIDAEHTGSSWTRVELEVPIIASVGPPPSTMQAGIALAWVRLTPPAAHRLPVPSSR